MLLGFPSLIFMIALGAFAPASIPKWLLVVGVIGLFGWPSIARVVRGQSLTPDAAQLRGRLAGRWAPARLARAARAAAAQPRRHRSSCSPRSPSPANIGAEAALSFLGVGVPPPTPAWGRTISTAVGWIATDPWYLLAPALALFMVTFAFNLVGDGLRDALDPRLGGGR